MGTQGQRQQVTGIISLPTSNWDSILRTLKESYPYTDFKWISLNHYAYLDGSDSNIIFSLLPSACQGSLSHPQF